MWRTLLNPGGSPEKCCFISHCFVASPGNNKWPFRGQKRPLDRHVEQEHNLKTCKWILSSVITIQSDELGTSITFCLMCFTTMLSSSLQWWCTLIILEPGIKKQNLKKLCSSGRNLGDRGKRIFRREKLGMRQSCNGPGCAKGDFTLEPYFYLS